MSDWLEDYFITDTAVDSQFASTRDSQEIASGDQNHQHTPQPKQMVTAQVWHDWGNHDVGLQYEAWSNHAHSFELVCIATSHSYSMWPGASDSTLALSQLVAD